VPAPQNQNHKPSVKAAYSLKPAAGGFFILERET
jgi:hypothetical protein